MMYERPVYTGTAERMRDVHDYIKRHEVPLGVRLGPIMVIGLVRYPSLYNTVTRFAFWLLRKMGWEMIDSDDGAE